ncbi:hypothetical protein P280DRAFT_507439 [Massarina eburnea CBS 473.64]|uniref:DUF7907 domain-containing protein n=1 Tax=Massarina eburnea CBS 473.64 TaxID=1395130 RepID=A0A6A6S0H6_9PLEO|nr:hypothetical protein P280DRAFT_507439 [Massarina eburnea CBS 473.64]
MKLVFALAVFLNGIALAQRDANSKPFRLFIKSSNSTINGTALGACHQGAAIEGACITSDRITDPPRSYTTFYHSEWANEPANDLPGILFYNLTLGGSQPNSTRQVPSAMQFESIATSDIAWPNFSPKNITNTYVYFAKDCEEMYIPLNLDDTVSPPAYLEKTKKVQNWYVCLTRWSYLYTTLNWKFGVTGKPQNPSCQKVSVYRVFI